MPSLALNLTQAGSPHERRPASHPHPLTMKLLILFICLLLFTPAASAGWFFDDPPDLGPEYRAKIASLEDQMSEQHKVTGHWVIASGTLAFGCLLLFVVGTALGAKTRQDYDGTRTMERKPASGANGTRHHMGEAGAPDRRSSMAA